MDKVRLIKRSVRCLLFGWLSLIPLLGLVPAFIALHLHRSVRREAGGEWNPAASYARWGYVLALLGIAGWLTGCTGVFMVVLQNLF